MRPSALAHGPLDGGIDVRVGADRAGQLADGDRFAGVTQARAVAVDLQAPERELGAECRRFGVDAVRASCHCRTAKLVRSFAQHGDERGRGVDEQVGGLREGDTEGGVDDVGGGQAVVHPLPRVAADVPLHHVDERGDVVIGDTLALVHLGDERSVDRRR